MRRSRPASVSPAGARCPNAPAGGHGSAQDSNFGARGRKGQHPDRFEGLELQLTTATAGPDTITPWPWPRGGQR